MAEPTYHRLEPPHAVNPADLVESPILSEPACQFRSNSEQVIPVEK